MRIAVRFLTGMAFAAGLVLLPAGSVLHAAPSAGKTGVGERIWSSGPAFSLAYLASVEGISAATLQQDLQAGETLLQIAGDKYSSAADLATALLAPDKQKLEYAVSAGKLPQNQENKAYADLLGQAEALVVTPHPVLASGAGKKEGSEQADLGNIKFTMLDTVATNCTTTTDALLTAGKTGNTSILGACQATNPAATVDGLSAAIVSAVKIQVDAAVGAGKLTASQESNFLAKLQTSLSRWLTTPIPSSESPKNA